MPRSEPAWLRPSALPRLAACPASGVESEGYPDWSGDAAAIGTAWHEVAAIWLTASAEAAFDAIPGIALRHGVDGQTLTAWLGSLSWEPDSPVRICEKQIALDVADVTITGTMDLALPTDPPEVVDWKSGNPDFANEDAWWQLKPYGIAWAREQGASRAMLSLCYVQLGDDGWLQREIDVDDAASEVSDVVRRALEQRDRPQSERSYRVGEHCTFCPARVGCPARMAELRTFTALEKIDPALVTTANAAAILERARAVEKLAKAAKDAVKVFVEAHGGEVALDEGGSLRMVEVGPAKVPAHTRNGYSYVKKVK